MALVELRNVTRRYVQGSEAIVPLDDVSLEIDEGQFVSLQGASGTGKSTLLNLVAGIDRPDQGQVRVAETDLARLSRSRLAAWRARNVGYVFQTHNLVPVLTAWENVELPLLLLPLARSERHKRVRVALEAVGLQDRASHYPRQLSGGQEQRVGIARAIVAHPRLVVADEPTGDLDQATTRQILELLRRINRELNVTLLMVTHDPAAAAVADRRLRLHEGKLITDSRAAEAASSTSASSTSDASFPPSQQPSSPAGISDPTAGRPATSQGSTG